MKWLAFSLILPLVERSVRGLPVSYMIRYNIEIFQVSNPLIKQTVRENVY